MTRYVFLCANFVEHNDTRFFYDLIRLNYAFTIGSISDPSSIHAYSNPTMDTWTYYIHPRWQLLKQYLPESAMKELNLLESPTLRDPAKLREDLLGLKVTANDHVVIYLTDQGLRISMNTQNLENKFLRPDQIQEVLAHILSQGASVLFLISACSSKIFLRTFVSTHLKGIHKSRCTVFLDDSSSTGGYSYNVRLVPAQEYIGTEFCHVLLILLDRLKSQSKRNPSLREFHAQFPNKFIAYFGSNGEESISDFFGHNIINYLSEIVQLPSTMIEFISITGFNSSGQNNLRSLIAPKLILLLTRLLGHSPTDEEISIEFNDTDFEKYYPRVVEICQLLEEKKFIIAGLFPAPGAVNCLVDIPSSVIQQAMDFVEQETSALSSDIK